MPSNPPSQWRRVGVALVVVVLAALGWSGWAARTPPETALRTDLVLRDGVLSRPKATVPFTGLLVENWSSTQRRVEVTIVAGRAHGLSRGWHENGQREVEEHFDHGVSHGTRTRWLPDGAKKSQVEIRDGQLSGVFREWHTNGRLSRETPLREGVAHGEAKSWDAQGKLLGTAKIENGKLVGFVP